MKRKDILTLILASLTLIVGCSKEQNGDRSEYIEVYRSLADLESSDVKPLNTICVEVKANITTLFVRTNTKVDAFWQDATESAWASVKSYSPTLQDGVYELSLDVSRINSSVYYTRRSGTLFLSNKDICFGRFLKVHQGATARYSCNMAALEYGNGNPLSEDGIVLYQDWSAGVRKSCDFSSTPFADGTTAYLYGMKGYVRLGDDKGHGADLITPFVSTLRSDSLVMASFNAVAYASVDGVKDDSKFKVEVLGGGVIADFADKGLTEIEFEAGHLNPSEADFPSGMWKGASYLVFIKSTAANPITADTRLRITVGNLKTVSPVPSRLFVDNIYLRRLVPGMDEDYFTENHGSGPDIILGR